MPRPRLLHGQGGIDAGATVIGDAEHTQSLVRWEAQLQEPEQPH